MRVSIAIISAILFFAAANVGAAPLEPSETIEPLPPGLTDQDGDNIADALQARLATLRPGEVIDVIVTLERPGNARHVQRTVGPFVVKQNFRLINGFAAAMTGDQIRATARLPGVFRVEPDFEVTKQDESTVDFGAATVWSNPGINGSGVTICIVDTGVDATHEQLDNNKVVLAFSAPGLSGSNDDNGHGTHVAGIAAGHGFQAAGDTSDAETFKGVAWGASIMAAKVLDASGSGTASQVIAGIQWCAEQADAKIISMSLGTAEESDGQGALAQAVDAAAAAPYYKVPVVAAGNSGAAPNTIGDPGASERAITVGAVAEWSVAAGLLRHDNGVHIKTFSSRGPIRNKNGTIRYIKPDIMGPGAKITSAKSSVLDINLLFGCADPDYDNYITCSGTSMATPFVAGAIALAMQADPTLALESGGVLPVDKVRQALAETAQDRGPPGLDSDWGWGLIDVEALVANVSGAVVTASATGATSFPSYQRIEGSVGNGGLWSHQFDVAADNLDIPIGATVTIDGQVKCALRLFGSCLLFEWQPDLEARMIDPNGTVLALSECPARGECGPYGRQENISVMPTVAGTYTIEVFPFSGSGGFAVDLSKGPLSSTPAAPPGGNAPTAAIVNPTGGTVQGSVTIQVSATDIEDAAGTLTVEVSVGGESGQSAPYNATSGFYERPWDTASLPDGTYTIDASATDSDSQIGNANQISVTVDNGGGAGSPAGNHIGDLDGGAVSAKRNWIATVDILVHDTEEKPLSGVAVDYEWSGGFVGAGSCTTNVTGRCSATSENIPKKHADVTFLVKQAGPPATYSSADNHDPDGDSTGSVIIVSKP